MNLTKTQQDKLIALYPELRDWVELKQVQRTLAELVKIIEEVKNRKITDGYTPIKGVDYVDGKDYVLSEHDKKEIAEKIKVPIVEKVIEKTTVVKEQPIFHETVKNVENKETPESIARKLNTLSEVVDVSVIKGALTKRELETHLKNVDQGMAKIDGRMKLVDQRWHGAGLSKVSTDSTLTGNGTPSSPLSVVGGVSSGFQRPLSGVVDGVNTIFVWATAPNVIVVDQGRVMQKTNSDPDSNANWTGTTTTTLQVAPNTDIFATA